VEEALIGGFMSPNIKRGTIRGYGLYVTTQRIIGVKKGWKHWVGSIGELMGPTGAGAIGGAGFVAEGVPTMTMGTALPQLSVNNAGEAIRQLESSKDFEVSKDELEEIRVQRNKGWFTRNLLGWSSDVTIRAAGDVYRIRVASEDDARMMRDLLKAFDETKLVFDSDSILG
jgi:hypothetical protein